MDKIRGSKKSIGSCTNIKKGSFENSCLRKSQAFIVQLYINLFQIQFNIRDFLFKMNESIVRPLNQSIKESLFEPIEHPNSTNIKREFPETAITEPDAKEQQSTPQKIPIRIKKIFRCGIFLIIVGLILFLALPPFINLILVYQINQQAILTPETQSMWAHIPGQSKTIITRNYTFFRFDNAEEFILYGHKPKFTEIVGYKIQQLQDSIDIEYNQDFTKVKYKDWLHFTDFNQSRNLQEKVEILNAPGIGYWWALKNSRDSLVFLEAFSVVIKNIEDSTVSTIIGQGISLQFLPDFNTTVDFLFKPAGISSQNSLFIWNDDAYGLNDKNNVQYWVQAAITSFTDGQPSLSKSAQNLKDYFTLSDSEMYYIINQIKPLVQVMKSIINNHYCEGIQLCDDRELAVRQISSSYATYYTPPVSLISPTDSICDNNDTCLGYYPQLSAYYKNVYRKQHPASDPFLKFQVDIARKWIDYNPSRIEGEYSKAQSALLHIGNLDALFDNGTLHDKYKKQHLDNTKYLQNIKNRFQLPTFQHSRVFWEWIKYIVKHFIRQNTGNNQKLGMGNGFSTALASGFAIIKDNLQSYLLKVMIQNQLNTKSCIQFILTSFQISNSQLGSKICASYNNNITSIQFVSDSLNLCRFKYNQQWYKWTKLGATMLNLQSFCDKSVEGGFGQLYHRMRVEVNDFYQCHHTPNQYCSDYQLALIQWTNSTVTRKHPPSASSKLKQTNTFADWYKNATKIQYYHYIQKFPNKTFPTFTIGELYKMFNYNSAFSAPVIIQTLKNQSCPQTWRQYMRYVIIFLNVNITTSRTAREFITGYNDEFILQRKNRYPPFGGDPSLPAFAVYNDQNLTKQEVTLEVQLYTGKNNPIMTSQYYKVNNLTYINQNYSKFNGNQSYWVLESPWQDIDYFFGTTGKKYAPNQFQFRNISCYAPSLQRYGNAEVMHQYHLEKYGISIEVSKLGMYMTEAMETRPQNKKYYQHYNGIFNQTSVLGFPFFLTKPYFLNSSDNWTSFIDVYTEQNQKIQPIDTFWTQSWIIYEPYTGVPFQSILYMQASYFFEPDQLFIYNQTCLIPVFTVYRSGNLTEQTADKLFLPLKIGLKAKTISFIIGVIIALLGVVVLGKGLIQLRSYIKRTKENVYEEVEYKSNSIRSIKNSSGIINQQKQSVLTDAIKKQISQIQQIA